MSTISEVCAWCDISAETFHDAVRRGIIPKQPRAGYDEQAVARVLIKDAQARKGGHGDLASAVGLSEARAALAREQTQAVALKNAVARGEYAPLTVIRREIETVFTEFRERILSIPGKIAAICEMRSRIEVEEIVRDECYEALEELSRPILPADGTNDHSDHDDEAV
jgi:phage terminase Nu1 subunit (DNA packaging protein)